MKFISDCDTLDSIDAKDLWVVDKFILSKRLGYVCGPAGVLPPKEGLYIVRPCINFRMMSSGAKFVFLDTKEDQIPDGFFWCEIFEGRHLSFDYNWGKQILAVEGFRDEPDRLDRFSCWAKINDLFTLPDFLQEIAIRYEWFNVETIGNKIIEAHFRYNDDFANHNANIIIPIWKEEFYASQEGDRLGFLLLDDK
ncbi:hypothetical protein EB118_15795 [bacterium]|nr:hypothetical protein [bacterium]